MECSLNINWRVNKCGKLTDCLESYRTVWKVSGESGKFQDGLESSGPFGKFPDSVESKQVWNVDRLFGKLLDSLESFRRVWKVSRPSGEFPDRLESFRTVWKVSGQFGKFCTDCLESFRTVWKVSGKSGKFQDGLESFQTDWKVCRRSGKLYVATALSSLLAHICRRSDLRTFGAYMSRKRFTHSIQKVFAREILPTGKFWLFVSLP